MRRCRFSIVGAICLIGVWLASGPTAFGLATQAGSRTAASLCPAPRIIWDEASRDGGKRAAGQCFFAFQGELNRLEKRLFADAAEGSLDEHTLLDAALVASGVDTLDALRHYRRRYAALVDELRRGGMAGGSPRQQAEAIFAFMHRRILHAGYRIDSTDLRLALDSGWFNCVSASVLFNCLATEFGLPVCALKAPGHAKSRLLLPDGSLDVETTCPEWFRLLAEPQKRVEPGDEAPVALATGKHCRVCKISVVELVAMIYYNRGVDLLAQQEYAAAAAANAKALRLDPSSVTARGNLLATINNWAIALGTKRHYFEAANLLKQGMRLDPSFETFLPNYVHVCHQWTQQLCADGRFAEALLLLGEALADHPEQPYLRRASADVYRRWARSLSEAEKAGPIGCAALAEPYRHTSGVAKGGTP